MTTGLKHHTKEADQHKKTEREAKHAKESEHWLIQTSISNRYTPLSEKESEAQQQNASPENMPKPPPICITDVKNLSPLIQLLEQIAACSHR
jgi:hypothetical protein